MKFLIALIAFIPALLFAQGAQPELAAPPKELVDLYNLLGPTLVGFLVGYPFVIKFVLLVGMARPIFKPLNSFVWAIVNATPTKSDDEKFKKITGSKAYGIFAYLLDAVASIKAKNPKG